MSIFGLGRSTPRRPDQAYTPGQTVLAPGGMSGILRARVVIVSGPNDGVFIYSPNPGLGNLVGSWAAAAGIDQFGNAYRAGLVGYGIAPFPAAGNLTLVNAFGAVVFLIDNALGAWFQYADTGSATQGGLMASFCSRPVTDPIGGASCPAGMQGIDPAFGDFVQVNGSSIKWGIGIAFTRFASVGVQQGLTGPANPYIEIDAPEQNNQAGHNVIRLEGTSPDGTNKGGEEHWLDNNSGNVQSGFYAFCGDIDYLLPGSAVPGTVEVFNSLTTLFASGWANVGSGAPCAYRHVVSPSRAVELKGDFQFTSTAAGESITASNALLSTLLPAAYRPASIRNLPVAVTGGTMPSLAIQANRTPLISISPTGQITLNFITAGPSTGAGQTASFSFYDGFYSLLDT